MIVASNTSPQVLQPGAALTFNNLIWKSGCAESFRNLGSAIRLTQGVFEIGFNGNITGETANTALQLNIEIDGSPLPETTMISTPSAENSFNNVSASTYIGNQATKCNCCPGNVSISVVNTGTEAVTVAANSKLSARRIG